MGIILEMTLLPIQFQTKFKKSEIGEISTSEILDLVKGYLQKEDFGYISKKENRLVFHAAHATGYAFHVGIILVSGVVKVKDKGDTIVVTNGNWMVLLIAVPFILFLVASKTEFSALSTLDVDMIWIALLFFFGFNLGARILAHLNFKWTIQNLIKNYTQHRL